MSGNASSEGDDLVGRVFEDLHNHERTRSSSRDNDELRDLIREAMGQRNTDPDLPKDRQARPVTDDLLAGQIALEWGIVDQKALEACLQERESLSVDGRKPPLGEIFERRGLLNSEGLDRLLKEQLRRSEGIPDFPRYEIRERLGEGVTAVVYDAWDRELQRRVALKVLREPASLNEVARLRFRREAQAAAGLAHPNVVTVYDAGEIGGRLYIVMELVEGRSFGELLKDGNATPRAVLALIAKAARGVGAAHDKGIIHRDLKPANILVTSTGEPKVGDFGLAHLSNSGSDVTRTGTPLGTPLYMSPEQVKGSLTEQSPRTDVYSLGAILYEALVGRPPHQGETVIALYHRIVEEPPVIPQEARSKVPEDLRTVALKALEKDPALRYATAKEFASDIEACLKGEPISGRLPGVTYRLFQRLRKHRVATLLAAAAAIGIIGTWFLVSRQAHARFSAERDTTVTLMREIAKLSLDSALELREKGENEKMRALLPRLEVACQGARERAPHLAEVEFLMGRMHRALLDNERALEFQETALRKNPDYAPALYERAILRSRKWGLEASAGQAGPSRDSIVGDLTRLLKIRDSSLSDAQILAARGILAHFQGRHPEARELLETAVKKAPLLDEAWETLARVISEQSYGPSQREGERKYLEEEKSLTEAILRDRGFTPYLLGRGDVRRDRGNDRSNRGENPLPDYQSAEEDYTEVLRLNGEAQEGWHRRSAVRTLRATFQATRNQDPLKDYADAEKDADKLARLAPQSDIAIVWRSVIRVLRGSYLQSRGMDPLPEYARAIEDAAAGLRLSPKSENAIKRHGIAHVHRAMHLLDLGGDPSGDFDTAESDLVNALARQPDSAEDRLWLGVLHLQQGRFREIRREDPRKEYEEAEKQLSKAVEGRHGYVRAKIWRAITRMHQGDLLAGDERLTRYGAALTDLAEAIQLNRGFTESWLWHGVLNLRRGVCRAEQGADPKPDFTEADKSLSVALDLDPGYAEAWMQKGNLHFERGRVKEQRKELSGAGDSYRSALDDWRAALRINALLKGRIAPRMEEVSQRLPLLGK